MSQICIIYLFAQRFAVNFEILISIGKDVSLYFMSVNRAVFNYYVAFSLSSISQMCDVYCKLVKKVTNAICYDCFRLYIWTCLRVSKIDNCQSVLHRLLMCRCRKKLYIYIFQLRNRTLFRKDSELYHRFWANRF